MEGGGRGVLGPVVAREGVDFAGEKIGVDGIGEGEGLHGDVDWSGSIIISGAGVIIPEGKEGSFFFVVAKDSEIAGVGGRLEIFDAEEGAIEDGEDALGGVVDGFRCSDVSLAVGFE